MCDINIEDYSEKSFAVFGDTKKFKDDLKNLGGKFNSNLKGKAGWIFYLSNKIKVQEFIDSKKDDLFSIQNFKKILFDDNISNDEKIIILKKLLK